MTKEPDAQATEPPASAQGLGQRGMRTEDWGCRGVHQAWRWREFSDRGNASVDMPPGAEIQSGALEGGGRWQRTQSNDR